MHAELLKLAHAARPDLIDKVAVGMVVLEKLFPEEAEEVKANFAFITGKAEEGVKTAAPNLGRFGMAVGATVAAGLGSAIASDLYDEMKRGMSRGRNFKNIMNANPDLIKAYDKSQLRSSFNVVHRYAPEFTADPMMGGALLKSLTEMPQSEHQVIEKLINARKNLIEAKRKQFSPSSFRADILDNPKEGRSHSPG